MNELRKFDFKGNNVRTLEINSEPYFVGKDVADVLGYVKTRNALTNHVPDKDKKDAPIQGGLGGTQQMTVINESGLYKLIFKSKLPNAEEFTDWVTSEVLPTIRKRGAYMTTKTQPNGFAIIAVEV